MLFLRVWTINVDREPGMLKEKEQTSIKPPHATIPAVPEDFLSDRTRNLLFHLRTVGGLAKIIDTHPVIDVRICGTADNEAPLLPRAISIEINPADSDGPEHELKKLEAGEQCIILRGALQHLADYRRFIGVAFSKLAISGYLVITVPHQFLSERESFAASIASQSRPCQTIHPQHSDG